MAKTNLNLEGYEFLTETVNANRLQTEARNILDSYSHTWDLLAEALQNSVDAIEQRRKDDPKALSLINIVFNASQRSIEVSDTGIGMSADQVRRVLAPHQGLKRGKGMRGEKGVGLSFILFMTNRFRIETCDGEQTTYVEIHRANDWSNGTENDPLKFVNVRITGPSTFQKSTHFTRIWAEQIPAAQSVGDDIFEYTKPRLLYVLRTKTAVGNTYPLFNEGRRPPIDIQVKLQYLDHKGTRSGVEDIPYSFAAPDSLLKPKDVLTWQEYVDRRVQNKKTQAKGLVHVGTATSDSGKSVKWYTFIAARPTFDEISEINKLQTSDMSDVDAGIFISTRGMPTGIRLTPPRSQQAAYWMSFFILLEYDDLRLDMGRKFVGGRVGQMLSKVALTSVYNVHVNAIPTLTIKASDPFDGLQTDQLIEEIKTQVANTRDLELSAVPYVKVPIEEQGVVAIFHELVGAGLLKGYRTLRSSSHERYDTYLNYKPDPSVMAPSVKRKIREGSSYNIFAEFKYEAGRTLLDDFDVRKRPRDFRLLICWTLNESVFKDKQIDVERIEPTETVFHGATHRLIFPNSYGFGAENTLHVIALKDLIKELKQAE
ncbi:MAG TPA: ATP-binding protein [Pyrinomonadaceae bacterium]|jgi:hypothetical protein